MALESPVIDAVDRRILDLLTVNARSSWRELADAVHLSPTSVADRVRRLERDGVITGYHASVDAAALGRSVRAVVDVSLVPGDTADDFEQRLSERDEVVLAAYVTGSADYTIVVDCEGTAGLDAFVRWLRADVAVARTESKLMLRALKD